MEIKPIKERAKDYVNSLESMSDEEFDEFLNRWAAFLKEKSMKDTNENVKEWVEERTWSEFQSTGLIWWVNTMLHTFGWAIAYDMDEEGNITRVFPVRTKYRGFSQDLVEEGYKKVTKYMRDNAKELYKETQL